MNVPTITRDRALDLIGDNCETFTSGKGSCFRYGRTADAEYMADSACVGCIVWAATSTVRTPNGLTVTFDPDAPADPAGPDRAYYAFPLTDAGTLIDYVRTVGTSARDAFDGLVDLYSDACDRTGQ